MAVDAARVRVDVAALAVSTPATTEALERLAAAYAGPFLDDFTLDEAPFDEWAEAERARLRAVALGAVEALADKHAEAGALDAAIRAALQALRVDPLHERSHRRLMALHARSGQRAAAIQQYRSFAAALERELGVKPEEETSRL